MSYQDKNITCIDPCLPIDGRYVDRCFCRDNGLLLPKLAQVAPSSDTEALRSFKREGKGIFDGDKVYKIHGYLKKKNAIKLFFRLPLTWHINQECRPFLFT